MTVHLIPFLQSMVYNSLHLARKYARIHVFVHGHYLFQEVSVGTDYVQGQKISLGQHIFMSNGGCCVYYPSNLFCNTCSFENWGIFSDIPQFSWGICGHMTHLDQSLIHEQKLKCSYTVMARPMKTLELHFPMILFLVIIIIDLMFLEQ